MVRVSASLVSVTFAFWHHSRNKGQPVLIKVETLLARR
jgi:hypothetical protein